MLQFHAGCAHANDKTEDSRSRLVRHGYPRALIGLDNPIGFANPCRSRIRTWGKLRELAGPQSCCGTSKQCGS
jgi:hypothetical protein